MTTNGDKYWANCVLLFPTHPSYVGIVLERKLERLLDGGVNAINISLDTMGASELICIGASWLINSTTFADKLKFNLITRRNGWDKVMSGRFSQDVFGVQFCDPIMWQELSMQSEPKNCENNR